MADTKKETVKADTKKVSSHKKSTIPFFKKSASRSKQPRLFANAIIGGYRRNMRKQRTSQALLKIEGVQNTNDATWYAGKKVAYVWKSKITKGPRTYHGMRVSWGRVVRPHGKNGVVRAIFKTPVPATSFGQRARVFLYPSRI